MSKTKRSIMYLIVALCIALFGYVLGSNCRQSIVTEAKAAESPMPAPPSMSWTWERAYIEGQYYIVFTSAYGGIYAVRK